MLIFFVTMIVAYLIGSIPAAYLLAKKMKGVDIREEGSGNVGATNASRVLGKLPGLAVLIFDLLKGTMVVIFLAKFLAGHCAYEIEFIKASLGLAVVLGHIYSVFLKFKGGKGVATSTGVLLAISPFSVLIGAVIFLVTVFLSRYVSLGSIISSMSIPFLLIFRKEHTSYIILSAMLCIIIVIKHKPNIKRLLMGRENKVFGKSG